jgi:general secretion pathway protein D
MLIYIAFILVLLTGCAPQPIQPSSGHLHTQSEPSPTPAAKIPPPILNAPYVPPPSAKAPKTELFTVVVDQVPAKELLFALARDAKLNVDIDPRIKGVVSMNAIDQTLAQLLDRIAKQLDLRYQLIDNQLSISLDTAYVQTYKVDYVNMNRDSESKVSVSTQVATSGSVVTTGGSSGSGGTTTIGSTGGNNSQTAITDVSKNRFWETLEKSINAILLTEERTTITRRKQLKASSKADDVTTASKASDIEEEKEEKVVQNNVMVNPESGMISIRGTSRQHTEIKTFLEKVINSIQRQVLVEATIVEVVLNDQYQSGINWQRLGGKFNIVQNTMPAALGNAPFYGIGYADKNSGIGDVSAAIKLLENFGNTKVLSSPKIMALNNQPAILKVVDNIVYFTLTSQPVVTSTNNTAGTANIYYQITTEVKTVPDGLIMNITPQISADDNVMLNVRPTITRIIGYRNDPNPDLARAGVVNQVPIVQIREIESLLKIRSGNIAMIGGLMQNTAKQGTDGIPVVSKLPVVGDLFSQRDDQYKKSELVIFLRPVVIKDAAINGDFQNYRQYLPDLTQPEPAPITNIPLPN